MSKANHKSPAAAAASVDEAALPASNRPHPELLWADRNAHFEAMRQFALQVGRWVVTMDLAGIAGSIAILSAISERPTSHLGLLIFAWLLWALSMMCMVIYFFVLMVEAQAHGNYCERCAEFRGDDAAWITFATEQRRTLKGMTVGWRERMVFVVAMLAAMGGAICLILFVLADGVGTMPLWCPTAWVRTDWSIAAPILRRVPTR